MDEKSIMLKDVIAEWIEIQKEIETHQQQLQELKDRQAKTSRELMAHLKLDKGGSVLIESGKQKILVRLTGSSRRPLLVLETMEDIRVIEGETPLEQERKQKDEFTSQNDPPQDVEPEELDNLINLMK